MRIDDLFPGDVFYLKNNPRLGPLLRKYTTRVDSETFALIAYLSSRLNGFEDLMHRSMEVIKVGRLEAGDSHDN